MQENPMSSGAPPNALFGPQKTNVGPIDRRASLAGGGALILAALARRSPLSLALAPVAGYLLYRGATGHCFLYDALGLNTAGAGQGALVSGRTVTVEEHVTVDRPVRDVYCFWHDFTNFPRFMAHLESVTATPDGLSHWVAKAPLGRKVEWDAEIINEQQDELIAWRSLGPTATPNAGYVHFHPAPDGRGTVVHVSLEYAPPAGLLGSALARLLREEPHTQVHEDLRRFKNIMEAGEIPTAGEETSTLRVGDRFKRDMHKETVEVGEDDKVAHASAESFPASDPPSYTGTITGSDSNG